MANPTETTQGLIELSQNTVYLMGISFVLGSLFTIFVLVILELIRSFPKQKTGPIE